MIYILIYLISAVINLLINQESIKTETDAMGLTALRTMILFPVINTIIATIFILIFLAGCGKFIYSLIKILLTNPESDQEEV